MRVFAHELVCISSALLNLRGCVRDVLYNAASVSPAPDSQQANIDQGPGREGMCQHYASLLAGRQLALGEQIPLDLPGQIPILVKTCRSMTELMDMLRTNHVPSRAALSNSCQARWCSTTCTEPSFSVSAADKACRPQRKIWGHVLISVAPKRLVRFAACPAP